ncbi:MAG: response regulator [Halieaceae bacterium]|nr:response regulator [Halieaceae bacterium]MDG0979189.1 response regulator [Halieaceae bacterium]
MVPPSATAHILIVDDDEAIRRSLLAWTKSLGIDAIAYDSYESCVEGLRRQDFTLQASPTAHPITQAIIDVTLPGESGLALFEVLSPPLTRDQVVLITARADDLPHSSRDRNEANFRHVLKKPFDLDELESLLGL